MSLTRRRQVPAGDVLVANPGGVSWMLQSARILSEHGRLAAYCSPMAYHADELGQVAGRLPGLLAGPVTTQLALRAAPPSVPAERIVRTPATPEALMVLSLRLGLPESVFVQLDHLRSATFDRAVASMLHPGIGAVIGYQGAAACTFTRARQLGIPCILDYPVAHYEITGETCREENRLVPEYAGTMQGHNYAAWRLRRYAAEIKCADRIIMESTYHQRTFEAAGVAEDRFIMAPFGVDLETFRPGTPQPDDATFRVMFCGQISQRKGISYLVEAFQQAGLEDAELVFVGRPVGTSEPWISAPRVRYVPAVPRPKLAEIYRSAHVIVLPSLIESFGATPLEAMACGVPAIVSEHTFADDVIDEGEDGWVVPIRNAAAIAEHLRTLYDDRERQRRMGAAARKKAEQYPWDRYGNALLAGIEPLLAGRVSA